MNVELKKIELSMVNPRFTTIPSMDSKLLENIIIGNKDYDEQKTIINLLKREGDLSDFSSLIQSISLLGFDTDIENILVVSEKDKIIVAEGNRRILALKILNGILAIPPIKEIKSSFETENNIILDEDMDSDKIEINYKNILLMIEKFKNDYKSKSIEVSKIVDEEKLWKLIYTKHIVGERPGMRKWSRGKYFVDILSFFPKGFSKEEDDKTEKMLLRKVQRSIKSVKSDFKQAQFVRDIIWSEFDFGDDKLPIVYETMKRKKISALQSNFSLKRIKDVANKKLYINNKDFELYTKVEYNNELIIKYINGKLTKKEILNFILKWYNAGAITTRPIRENMELEFSKAVFNLLNKKQVENVILSGEVENGFLYSPLELEKIIDNTTDELEKKTLKNVRKVIISTEKMKKIIFNNDKLIIKSDDPMRVFKILNSQLKHNSNTHELFLNAIGATIRSILEQIYVWGGYFDTSPGGIVLSLVGNVPNPQDEYIRIFAADNSGVNKIFRSIRETTSKPGGNTMMKRIIMNITKVTEQRALEISDFLIEYSNKINPILNESIHASHRIYSKSNLIEFLNHFNKFQIKIIELIENLDFKKINILSNEIKIKVI